MRSSRARYVHGSFHQAVVSHALSLQWLKARGTTLGADNGIGVAAAFAVLEDPAAVHGPLECLFTADEEDDFFGVENLPPAPFLRSSILLNLDSEQEHVFDHSPVFRSSF
jgi:di/tripeptidase